MSASQTFERQELLDACDRLGYPEALREEDFPVWSGAMHAEVACFAISDRMDMDTATMVVGVALGDRARERHFEVSRALAAPICLLHAETTWEVFSVHAEAEPRRLSDGPSPDENPVLARFLAPEALLAAKREPQQLALLDIDISLLDVARGAAGRELDRRVKSLIADLMGNAEQESEVEAAARLVVCALTALAVRDKLTPDRSLTSAIARVQELSPGHLSGTRVEDIVDAAERLGDGLNFKTLDPALLGDVYERAVLIPAKRLSLGAYYTPPEIGRRMLENLPVEHVDPERRRFLDPSCGSGTLLLAANDRLANSLSEEPDDRRRHEYAVERLIGADNDPFAVELARLALFLQALPYGNGYRVEQADALVEASNESQATFTVSNPPWAFVRHDGEREQRADGFLRRLVARTEPSGFVACVLPVSWLTDDTSRESRAWLREHADVFEVWRLPTRSFRSSTMAPCVVFAQVGEPSGLRYRYANVWSTGRDRFRLEGVADEAILTKIGSRHEPLTSNWLSELPEFDGRSTLGEVALIRDGAPVPDISQLDSSGPHQLLRKYGDVLPFGTVDSSVTTRCAYPTDFSKRGPNASPEHYLKAKVLVSAMTSVDVPWRLRAFADTIGVIPRNSMYAVVPREDLDRNHRPALMFMLGLLSSAIASLWVAQRTATRMINARTIASVPTPPPETWKSIAAATHRVVKAQAGGIPLDGFVKELDVTVFEAFELAPASVELIVKALAGHKAPEGVVRFEPAQGATETAGSDGGVRGAMTADVEERRIKLDVPGLTESGGQWSDLPENLPGWLARSGASFDVLGGDDDLRAAQFRFQADAWMQLDELLAEFG